MSQVDRRHIRQHAHAAPREQSVHKCSLVRIPRHGETVKRLFNRLKVVHTSVGVCMEVVAAINGYVLKSGVLTARTCDVVAQYEQRTCAQTFIHLHKIVRIASTRSMSGV